MKVHFDHRNMSKTLSLFQYPTNLWTQSMYYSNLKNYETGKFFGFFYSILLSDLKIMNYLTQ